MCAIKIISFVLKKSDNLEPHRFPNLQETKTAKAMLESDVWYNVHSAILI
jgi:hypothetical protein